MRRRIRKLLTGLFATSLLAIIIAVLGEWFIEVAKDKGWYEDAGQTWDRIMGTVLETISSVYVIAPLSLLAGTVAGMWLDHFLKKSEEKQEKEWDWDYLEEELNRGLVLLDIDNSNKADVKEGYALISQETFTVFFAILKYLSERGVKPVRGFPDPREFPANQERFLQTANRFYHSILPFVRAKDVSGVMGFTEIGFSFDRHVSEMESKSETPVHQSLQDTELETPR